MDNIIKASGVRWYRATIGTLRHTCMLRTAEDRLKSMESLRSLCSQPSVRERLNTRQNTPYTFNYTIGPVPNTNNSSIHAASTLWCTLLPCEYRNKASRARPGLAVICNFWHLGTLTLSPERQNAQMSKITNDGLTRSGIRCFIAVHIWASKA